MQKFTPLWPDISKGRTTEFFGTLSFTKRKNIGFELKKQIMMKTESLHLLNSLHDAAGKWGFSNTVPQPVSVDFETLCAQILLSLSESRSEEKQAESKLEPEFSLSSPMKKTKKMKKEKKPKFQRTLNACRFL